MRKPTELMIQVTRTDGASVYGFALRDGAEREVWLPGLRGSLIRGDGACNPGDCITYRDVGGIFARLTPSQAPDLPPSQAPLEPTPTKGDPQP